MSCIITGASTGCSLFVPVDQSVTIRPSDPTAEILINGKSVGSGTVSTTLRRNKSHAVIAGTPSGKSGTAKIDPKISGAGVLDIAGGFLFLIPFLAAFGPGFFDLNQTDVSVILS